MLLKLSDSVDVPDVVKPLQHASQAQRVARRPRVQCAIDSYLDTIVRQHSQHDLQVQSWGQQRSA